nr:retrotransposon protein, putative, Ty1-copia subclass [Tanacetum cinerariifolium]
MTTSSTNNSVFKSFFEKQKLTGPNFIDWYRQLRIVLSIKDKLHYLEQPIPSVPEAPKGQQVSFEILEAHYVWIKGSKEIDDLILMSMDSEIQRNLEPLHAHEMLKELKTLFAQQAEQELLQTTRDFHSCKQEEGQLVSSYVLKMKGYIDNLERLGHPVTLGLGVSLILIGLRKEYDGFVQNYNMNSMGKTVNELHAMLKLHEQTLTLPKSNAPALHAIRADKSLEEELSSVSSRVNEEEEKRSFGSWWFRFFIIELNTILNRSWIYDTGCGTHICNTTQGLRASRKLKPRALSLYVGNGQREAVEAIGAFYLCLPSGLEIVLNNCHYAPSITRGVISVSRLYEDGFVNHFIDNTIQVSRNNVVYFSVVPKDGIFEIDLSNSLTNESSVYAVSNKRAKLDLDSALLWHCRLGHISKKRIEKLQHDVLLNSSDLRAFKKCVFCMSGKMARKLYTHQVEMAKDLLGLIHTDVCGPFKIMSRQGASYFVTFTDDFSRYGYVYLLKHKHEVFETFKVFQKEVENQLGKTIKSLRFDRGGEYMSQYFLDHLKDHGIIAHRTPPYTPQHNGYPKETMGYSFYYPPENKVIVARNAEFLENSLIDQEASRSLEDLEIIQEEDTHPSLNTSQNHEEDDLEIDEPQSDIVPIRRSTRTRHAPDRMCLYIDAEEHELGDLGEPANYKATLLDPESEKWLNAMNVEMQSMKDNEVWVLVELPPNGKTVGSKWLFKKKTDMDGNVHIYKARLVAKGYTKTPRIDYEETFSPVEDIRAIRILIAIAAYYDYEIWQMDVKTAFLNGYLNGEVYMEKPEGFVNPKYPNRSVKNYLGKCFAMKDLGEAAYILKIKIYRDRSKRLIGLCQSAYIEKILKRYCMENSKRGRDIHWTTVKNILKYLGNTKDVFLVYGGDQKRELRVSCYTDPGYLTDADDLKSQAGYVFVLNGGAIDWKSAKQSIFATSSAEAEYIATFDASKEAVWIMSRQGASYFVTFTDDFSRYGYVYLLKHKHEVFETFKVIQKEVENQLGKTIKLLRSDRGGEYISQEFLDHLKDHGIIAHRTPPYTPQHNDTSLNHEEGDLEIDEPQSDIVPIRRSTRTRHAPDLELPPNGKTIGSKWLFKKKTDMNGNVHIYKARLVAKGYTQTPGIDYEETFSPVADIRAIRILIAIAAYYDYEIWQMDVKTAFLNGYLNEETTERLTSEEAKETLQQLDGSVMVYLEKCRKKNFSMYKKNRANRELSEHYFSTLKSELEAKSTNIDKNMDESVEGVASH